MKKTNDLFNSTMGNQISDKQISEAFNNTFRVVPISEKETIASQIAKKSSKTNKKTSLYYEINIIKRGGGILNKRLIVLANDYKLIKSISCYKNDSLFDHLNDENNYSTEIFDDGLYTIKIEDVTGKVYTEDIEVIEVENNNIDIKVTKDKEYYTATIKSLENPINYDSILIVNESNNPVKYMLKDDKVVFPCDNKITIFSIADIIGNVKKIILTSKNK